LSGRAITDSTCLIAMQRIGQLDILSQVFSTVIAPEAVREEVGIPIPWLDIRTPGNLAVVSALRTQLDDGEANVIALALELGDVSVILDDKKARRIARQMGLRVIGTVGILVRAKRKGVCGQVKPMLDALDNAGFRMTKSLRHEALRLSGESD
jgi:predicted nucleic acid-binding protein